MKHKGFTLVELLIVIVVIAILATIGIVSYSSVRGNAVDSKIKSIVKTVGDAIQLHESQNNGRITAQGHFHNAGGVDSLAPKYLKPDYRDGISSKNATNKNTIFRFFNCNNGGGGFVIYASLNNPSEDDIRHFNEIRSSCRNDNYAPSGPNDNPKYNYAQVF